MATSPRSSSERRQSIDALVQEALRVEVDQRDEYLDRACRGDEDLRTEVSRLLASHHETQGTLPDPGTRDPSATPVETRLPASMPKQIGQYRIKRVIASGGMGTVYEASQAHPRRAVAVKVMNRGVASRSALRRFEYESQILARLRHPGIAQVYEAGLQDDAAGGGPYFAMEYIPNAKVLTEYAKQKRLGTRERLELFASVCSAVHHGHQKGIIHRDLKPDNILVDSTGQPKIIDFGVARATDSDMAVTTLQTDIGQLVGTLQYMSPEQVEADPHDIDIRSDVYALGVVLFELLTGKRPYEVTGVSMYLATRVIREQQPVRISAVDHSLRGDLEAIVLHALEKERERRYQSADELQRDICHYLMGEPIEARLPSLAYHVRLFAARHRLAFAAAAAIFLALIAGVAGIGWGLVKANAGRAEAVTAREHAEREAGRAKTMNAFLTQMLTSVDPKNAQGREPTVRDLLDRVADDTDPAFGGDPELAGQLRKTVGMTYRSLGLFGMAEPQLRAAVELRRTALGEDHRDTLISGTDLALVLDDQGKWEEAESLLRPVLAAQRRTLGEEHPDTLRSMNNLAWLRLRRYDYGEAERLFRQVSEIHRRVSGEGARMAIKSCTNLALVLMNQGKLGESEVVLTDAMERCERFLGGRHPDTLYTLSIHGALLSKQRRFHEAVQQYQEVVHRAENVLGKEHPHTLYWTNELAQQHLAAGNLDGAETLAAAVLAVRQRTVGERHPATIESFRTVAQVLLAQDRVVEAEELYRRASELSREHFGATDLRTLHGLEGLARTLLAQDRFEEAEGVALECRAGFQARNDVDVTFARPILEVLIDLYEGWGKPDRAAAYRALLPGPDREPAGD